MSAEKDEATADACNLKKENALMLGASLPEATCISVSQVLNSGKTMAEITAGVLIWCKLPRNKVVF